MVRLLCTLVGSLLLLLGLISLLSPIPGSTLFSASGLTILICSSPWFSACIRLARGRFAFFEKLMHFLETHSGKKIGGVLQSTRPEPLQAEGQAQPSCALKK